MLSGHNARVWVAILIVAILIVLAFVVFGNHTGAAPVDCAATPTAAACQ